MKLLYESLRETHLMGIKEYFDKAIIFNVDNVAEFYYQSNQVEWDIHTDFPSIMPPFKYSFFEYTPPSVGIFQEGVKFITPGIRFGTFIVKHDVAEDDGLQSILECILFGSKNEVPFFLGSIRMAVDKYGAMKPLPGQNEEAPVQYLLPEGIFQDTLDQSIRPVFLAISFLHCKNVTKIERGAGTNIGKRNRHEASVRYHVLNIEPMKKILKTEGNSETVGLKKALHICRGHFKDYRETGLFGKLHDIYWWEPQVRGSQENGVVLKDYKINKPIN
jgi:hypothetical protein